MGRTRDIDRLLQDMDANVRTSLAVQRATLRTLASLSPDARVTAAMALEIEFERVANDDRPSTPQVERLLHEIREELYHAFTDTDLRRNIERALVDAADTLVTPRD